ncbi:MAG: HIT domain-containing protein [Candidatus Marinimicrobia bacterium]|nr:HIT domain-containing protein [Candidatus Neomarinimicrobiota bacterium]
MPDRLWAPWRMEYIRAPRDAGECIFCDNPAANDDAGKLLVYRGRHAFVMMNLYPYNNGHLLIAPYDHRSELDDLEAPVLQEMMELSTRAMNIMRREMNAGGFNFGANLGAAAGAGIEEHLHLHVVPRWIGDTNFMPVLGNTKVQVQGLRETRDLLAAAFEETSG